ncbi:hypothetical protein RCL1_008531 [Eukaryota sp. TZLM3-RCL]
MSRITGGHVKINGKTVSPDHVITDRRKGGADVLHHTVVRYEEPVKAEVPIVIGEAGDFIAINKPSSIPCHRGGRFCYNSLDTILPNLLHLSDLKLVHRLDRVTSGVLIYSKTLEGANLFREWLISRSLQKTYLVKSAGKVFIRENRL